LPTCPPCCGDGDADEDPRAACGVRKSPSKMSKPDECGDSSPSPAMCTSSPDTDIPSDVVDGSRVKPGRLRHMEENMQASTPGITHGGPTPHTTRECESFPEAMKALKPERTRKPRARARCRADSNGSQSMSRADAASDGVTRTAAENVARASLAFARGSAAIPEGGEHNGKSSSDVQGLLSEQAARVHTDFCRTTRWCGRACCLH
jgi:hypothetical protein